MEPIKVIKDEEYLAAARAILVQARNRVDLCTYKFELSKRRYARELNQLIQILYDLVDKRVRIRVLLNIIGRRTSITRINERAGMILKKNGLQVRYLRDNRCQHAKMLLVDGCLAIIGSHNWAPRAMTENSEMSVVFYGAQYLGEIEKHFEKLWESASEL